MYFEQYVKIKLLLEVMTSEVLGNSRNNENGSFRRIIELYFLMALLLGATMTQSKSVLTLGRFFNVLLPL